MAVTPEQQVSVFGRHREKGRSSFPRASPSTTVAKRRTSSCTPGPSLIPGTLISFLRLPPYLAVFGHENRERLLSAAKFRGGFARASASSASLLASARSVLSNAPVLAARSA